MLTLERAWTVGCGCGKSGAKAQARYSWTVDLSGTGKTFADGTSSKTYATIAEANTAINGLGLVGAVRPKPATAKTP